MFANERYEAILALVQEKGSVRVSDLKRLFGVSTETIRRDLEYLENQSALTRVHGGAISGRQGVANVPLDTRMQEHREQKIQLSMTAAGLVREDDIIAIDSGSTAMVFAPVLAERFTRLTVVTNSPEVLAYLSRNSGFTLIQIGGLLNREEQAFHGHMAEEMIRGMHYRRAFVFPSAVSLKQGAGVFIHELVGVQRAYMHSAEEVYILADSSKFETLGSIKLCDLFPHTVVTDPQLPPETRQRYRKHTVNIIL